MAVLNNEHYHCCSCKILQWMHYRPILLKVAAWVRWVLLSVCMILWLKVSVYALTPTQHTLNRTAHCSTHKCWPFSRFALHCTIHLERSALQWYCNCYCISFQALDTCVEERTVDHLYSCYQCAVSSAVHKQACFWKRSLLVQGMPLSYTIANIGRLSVEHASAQRCTVNVCIHTHAWSKQPDRYRKWSRKCVSQTKHASNVLCLFVEGIFVLHYLLTIRLHLIKHSVHNV